ncbi:hypothetical protein KVG29_08635, partial [Caldicoprobacter algeriensis]|uniref:hypothetical protein n=1 Tax=Caldicoprobacter algeriensis TaxID=699281 RepID=UPI00207AE018
SLTLENLHPFLDNIRFYILNSKNLDIYIILSFKKVLHLILQFSQKKIIKISVKKYGTKVKDIVQ